MVKPELQQSNQSSQEIKIFNSKRKTQILKKTDYRFYKIHTVAGGIFLGSVVLYQKCLLFFFNSRKMMNLQLQTVSYRDPSALGLRITVTFFSNTWNTIASTSAVIHTYIYVYWFSFKNLSELINGRCVWVYRYHQFVKEFRILCSDILDNVDQLLPLLLQAVHFVFPKKINTIKELSFFLQVGKIQEGSEER